MKKNIVVLLILIVCSSFILKDGFGVYKYKTDRFYESIELKKNYTFKYMYSMHNIKLVVNGNYRIIGDSLILDSNPQKDKIIVNEDSKGNLGNNKFIITDKYDNPFNYTLSIISQKGDTLILKNQWIKSKIKNVKIKEFYITDSKGLKSPTYLIKGKQSNCFRIFFETKRVFENEIWKINDDKIFPNNLSGEKVRYFLTK